MIALFINYFTSSNPFRQREYIHALSINLLNPLIDKVYVLGQEQPSEHSKIIAVPITGQPTYNDFFNVVNNQIGDDDISIIANLDIYFDSSISHVHRIAGHQCFALSRWEDGQLLQTHGDSQDAWIFRGKIRQVSYGNFMMGTWGCDNRIAHELKQAGYELLNPCHSIFAHHVHHTGIRQSHERRPDNTVPPPYHRVHPCHL